MAILGMYLSLYIMLYRAHHRFGIFGQSSSGPTSGSRNLNGESDSRPTGLAGGSSNANASRRSEPYQSNRKLKRVRRILFGLSFVTQGGH